MPGGGIGDEQLHVRVFTTTVTRIGPAWTGPHYNNFWRLYVNTRGGARIWTEQQDVRMAAWRVYIVPAWNRFDSHSARPIDHSYAHFDVVGLPAALIRACFSGIFLLKRDLYLDANARWWAHEMVSGREPDLTVLARTKALIFAAFAALLTQLPSESRAQCAHHLLGRRATSPALEHIENHLGEALDNAGLARLCHVSRDHFIRTFRREIGQTPAQYILERRISRAAQQLIFSSDSIDQIAAQTGFLDRFHFSRMFAARMGAPPARYRKTASRY